MSELEGVTVTPHLFLVSVPQKRFAEDNCRNAGLVDDNSLDPVRGYRALLQGMLAQDLKPLRRLLRKEFLLAASLGSVPHSSINLVHHGFCATTFPSRQI